MAVTTERAEVPRPYAAYTTIMGVFAGGVAVAGGVARLLDRDPRDQSWLDLATLSMASFKAARTIARDEVTSFIREPFVEGDPGEPERERPVQTGDMEQAIGELVTCSRCVGTWAAAGLVTAQILAPRFGRMLTWILAGAGVNDFLQAGFAALSQKANVLERRGEP
ncbi:MAG: DUF1360 domain-containing protein [Actinobacteria bacterium]|nr:DUF1360 domain-containing protein [Actinomycetota bacterium]